MLDVIVVGAGMGGLAAAAELARNGLRVVVLEAHIYPGGCAGTFYHQGYRFDAGATLAGGFASGAPLQWLGERFGIDWEERLHESAMTVRLPDGQVVRRWTDGARWKDERIAAFGEEAESFWVWQERMADGLWGLAGRLPAWPPSDGGEVVQLVRVGWEWMKQEAIAGQRGVPVRAVAGAMRPLSSYLPSQNPRLRQFVDGQLLISAQTTSGKANALYSAAALDLARRGVGSVSGGMGAIAEKMADAVGRFGGEVRYRSEVTGLKKSSSGWDVQLAKRRDTLKAKRVILNVPYENALALLGKKQESRPEGWGAFMLYLGLEGDALKGLDSLHQQALLDEPLGEGNSLFFSASPEWDRTRAPAGMRAVTVSTHTALAPWWQAYAHDRAAYEDRREMYSQRLLDGLEKLIPGVRSTISLNLAGTPITFERFTRRKWGWVGGMPQKHLLVAKRPNLTTGLWLVGDSLFPGQSVPAAAMGGVRVAQSVIRQHKGMEGLHGTRSGTLVGAARRPAEG